MREVNFAHKSHLEGKHQTSENGYQELMRAGEIKMENKVR